MPPGSAESLTPHSRRRPGLCPLHGIAWIMEKTVQQHDNSRPVQVHFTDLDAFGMVYHGYYAMIIDRAWMPFWTDRGYDYRSPDALQAVREMTVSYYFPIIEVGEVSVELWINRVGNTSADTGFAIRSVDKTVLHAEGRRVTVHIDANTLRPTPWSDRVRRDISALMRPQDSDDELGAAVGSSLG
jgi:acyl-CoA thioester hydrolase